ncbi:MAG TPA: CopG family transcriptional regulator [Thermoleophilaceae bacterium]|nr:CopG family transcriptional regulator [Thermoleophilaceae bacterium]
MKKTSLYLDAKLDHALARRAETEGLTKAELVRRILTTSMEAAPRPRPSACGVFDGPPDLGANADHHLADAGFGE